VLEGHTGPVVSASFSPDGQRVVSASDDGTARVWRADGSGTPMVLRGHEKPVRTAAFSPDGKLLASAGDDGNLILWSVEKTESLETLSGHFSEIRHVVFSPNGKTLASASEDRVILWNSEVHKTTDPHLKEVLGHIEKHYSSDLNQSSRLGGIPTLLGSLIFTLDTAAKAGDPETSNQAKGLRTRVINEYENIRRRTNSLQDNKCMPPNVKALDSRESGMTAVTHQEYQCFYPDHSIPSKEDDRPVQVNWYEALAYTTYQRTTLPNEAKAGSLNPPISTWCVNMYIARDEKQFPLLPASSLYRSTSPCLVKGRTALLEKRTFLIPRDFVDSGEGQNNNTSWDGPPIP
jgi:hypothetical protein